jgi:flagellar assembly protein FliH
VAPAAAAPGAAPTEPELTEQLRAAHQAGYHDGYRDGLSALEQFQQNLARQSGAQLGALLAATHEQLAALQQEMAASLALAATQIARQVVRSELALRPEAVTRVAEEAVDTLLQGARHLTVRVHPDDHGLVARGAAEAIGAREIRLVADAGVGRGGCIVESDSGAVDATVETRWRRACAALGIAGDWGAEAAEERA